MGLVPDSIKRSTDASGDEILTFETSGGKQVQGVAQVDELGVLATPGYGTNDVEEASATVTYVGKETASATWLVMKIDTTAGTVIRYASLVNNAIVLTYAAAWAARATTLVYSTYSEAL